MTTLYGLNNCSTCKKAMAWLDARGVSYDFIDYREHPIDPALLPGWAAELGGWEKLVNRASMTWRNLPEARKSPAGQDEWLALVAEFPALVRRPVLVQGGQVHVGFTERKYAALFGA